MKTYVCKIFGSRVNVFEADVTEQPKWWEVSRSEGTSSRIYKGDRHFIIGSLEEISKAVETMIRERKKALETCLERAEEDIARCRSLKTGMNCVITRGLREDFGGY